jgi:uncharacterized membrane protein
VCGRSHYDRSDHSGGYRGENIVSVDLAPFIAVWRLVEMILTIVHSFATLPVFIMHLVALFPFIMADISVVVMVVVVVILGEGNSTREKHCSERGKSKCFANVVHETSCSFDVTP